MKLLTFCHPETGKPAPGALLEDHWILDLAAASNAAGEDEIKSIDQLVIQGDEGVSRARRVLAHAEANLTKATLHGLPGTVLLAPFKPIQLRCFSVYPQHVRNATRQVLKHEHGAIVRFLARFVMGAASKRFQSKPLYYKGVHTHIVGPDASIIRPPYGERLDFELELGVIIGKQGKDISEGDALSHVFGYTIFNDVSARKQLRQEVGGIGSAGPTKGKDFDNSNIIGPWIVTRDEIADPQKLQGIARLNGKEIGRGNTSGMAHSIAREITHLSYGETIYPGELIGSGAMENCCGIEHWTFFEDGDEVDLEIEHIGTLTSRVALPGRTG